MIYRKGSGAGVGAHRFTRSPDPTPYNRGALTRWTDSIFGAAERHPGRTIAAVGFACAIAYAGAFLTGVSRRDVMRGDAVQYYAYLRSIVFDRDLDFQNEYEHFYAREDDAPPSVWLTERTPAGRPPNMMSVGPAILWSPAYLMCAGVLWLLSATGLGQAPTGFSTGLQLSAGVAGVLYATAGAWLSFLAARRLFSARAALWSTLVVWLAGPTVYYTVISPAYSHATSFFAVSLFVLLWLRSLGRFDIGRGLLLGLAGGLAALVRWQDAIVLLLPACELAWARLSGRLSTFRLAGLGSALAAGLLAGVSPQLLAWQVVYGSLLVIPQGGSFMRWTEPAILPVLFSTRRGLFLWTPALLVAAFGFVWLRRRDGLVGWAAMLTVAVAVYVNAAVWDWWAGEAFGARRFIAYTPLFALGLAALADRLDAAGRRAMLRLSAAGLIVYNLLFLLQYQLFMRGHTDLVPYPESLKQILVDRLFLPARLLAAWLDG
jgi:hypothetical protein